jgi:hypothetical protein
MKGNAWKPRKGHVLMLALLIAAVAGTLLVTPDSWAQDGEDECYFEDGTHKGWAEGVGTFELASEESLSATIGQKLIDRDGKMVRPIQIRGMAGRGRATGIGETVYWLDTSRPVESGLRSKLRGHEFPAVHEMGFHLYFTAEALPGKIFRSINPAIMVNDNATSFPPKPGTRYVLKNVVEFEDVDDPGHVAARILSNHNRYAGSRRPGLIRHFEN